MTLFDAVEIQYVDSGELSLPSYSYQNQTIPFAYDCGGKIATVETRIMEEKGKKIVERYVTNENRITSCVGMIEIGRGTTKKKFLMKTRKRARFYF